MDSLQKQFHDFIEEQDLLRKKEKVLLAVSGGMDSMVMSQLFLGSSWPFAIAHCNFNLRGEESDGDEAFVKQWGEKNTIEIHTRSFDLGKGSTQLNAREARYQWFEELCKEFGYTRVATAHHLDDSLETVLINLTRGTGIRGLGGIPFHSENIIRPLLFANRKQLREYADEHTLAWREDSSNAGTDYDRNLIRHQVIPQLMKLNPSLSETYKNTSERLQKTGMLLQSRVDEIRSNNLSEHETYDELMLSWISGNSDLIVLSEILSTYGFNYVTTKEIFKAIGKAGKSFPGESYTISMDRDSLFIRTNQQPASHELLIESEGEYEFGNQHISLRTDTIDEPIKKEAFIASFDAKCVRFPLILRKWKEGDRFRPLGMTGTKKVSDYLIDKKIPVALKEKVLVLTSENEIIWLVGHQLSDDHKVTNFSNSLLTVKLS